MKCLSYLLVSWPTKHGLEFNQARDEIIEVYEPVPVRISHHHGVKRAVTQTITWNIRKI